MRTNISASNSGGILNCLLCTLKNQKMIKIYKISLGTSLIAQWLRLRMSTAWGMGSSPGQELRAHAAIVAKKIIPLFPIFLDFFPQQKSRRELLKKNYDKLSSSRKY